MRHLLVACLLLFCPFTSPLYLQAQDLVEKVEETLPDLERITSLISIQNAIAQLKKELEEVRQNFQKAKASEEKSEYTNRASQLVDRIRELESNFTEIASGIDLKRVEEGREAQEISWNEEFKELVGPVLNELKEITSRPREISRLQSKIAAYQSELALIEEARSNVLKLVEATEEARKKDVISRGKNLIDQLKEVAESWEQDKSRIETQLAIHEQRKAARLSERKTLSQSLEQLFQVFFKTRGRNLLLAILASLLFWLVSRRIYKRVRQIDALRKRDENLAVRALYITFFFVGVSGSILVFLLSLYFFGDWVLLILAVMLLIGAVWASKAAIPIFWQQVGLILNMGPVRENERVMFQGIPWKVKTINFYTHLENPELSSGEIRLPISDLLDLRSRPFAREEFWFPTKSGDWVLIDDQKLARVVFQSPEVVKLIELGGAMKVFPTATFYEMAVKVLSKGFRISVVFGVDYQHQDKVTEEIPGCLQEALVRAIADKGYDVSEMSIQVEFKEAGASSLNLAILADFPGSLGKDYHRLTRLLNKVAVDTCTANGWVIPFDQLTLHVAHDKDEKTGSTASVSIDTLISP